MSRLAVLLVILCLSASGAVGEDRTEKIESCIDSKAQDYAKLCESAAIVASAIAHICAPAPLAWAPDKDVDFAGNLKHKLETAIHERAKDDALVRVLDLRTQAPSNCSTLP